MIPMIPMTRPLLDDAECDAVTRVLRSGMLVQGAEVARGLGVGDATAFFEEAGVGLSNGADFGLPGWLRLNFGCPRATLDAALERMLNACSRLPRAATTS